MKKHVKAGAFYRSNKQDVDEITEQFYAYYRHKLYDQVVKARTEVTLQVRAAYGNTDDWHYAEMHASGRAHQMFSAIKRVIIQLSHGCTNTMGMLIKRSYLMSYLGEIYAYEKLGRRPTGMLTRESIDRAVNDDLFNSNYKDRMAHICSNLYRELERTLEQSMLGDEFMGQALNRVDSAFGKIERIVQSREAAKTQARPAYETAILDQDDVDEMVEELRTVKGWNTREPRVWTATGKRGYEFERDMRTELVRSVRSGRIDAAEYVGYSIKDYIWNAVVDSKTDECCLKRDGLTMTEIKAKFHDDTAPPLHFNCRCDLIPKDEFLDDIWTGLGEPIEAEGFETWLKKLG